MEDRCVCCGEIIPEGSGMVYKMCGSVSSMKKRAKSLPKKKTGLKKS